MVYQGISRIQRILVASTCIACGGRGESIRDLCAECEHELPLNIICCKRCAIPLPFDAQLCGACLRRSPRHAASYCAYEYAYPILHFVRALKYGHSPSHARVLGGLLAEYLGQHHAGTMPDCFIPVPLATQRYRERGYNQVIELGRFVEVALQIPMNTQLVTRIRHTAEQAGLSRRERRMNLRGAFAVADMAKPKHVAILDDVITTGSTVNEIARTLKRAGVAHVEVWAVARAALK